MSNNDEHNQADLINYKFDQVFKRLDRMENTMNGFAFVGKSEFTDHIKEFNVFKEEVRTKFVQKESLTWVKTTVGGIAIGVGVTIVVTAIKLIGDNL